MDKNLILQLREEIDNKICIVLNENQMCECNSCIQCINNVLKILIAE